MVICYLIGTTFSFQAQDELVENQKHEAVRGEEGDPYNEENGEQVQHIYNLWLVEKIRLDQTCTWKMIK